MQLMTALYYLAPSCHRLGSWIYRQLEISLDPSESRNSKGFIRTIPGFPLHGLKIEDKFELEDDHDFGTRGRLVDAGERID